MILIMKCHPVGSVKITFRLTQKQPIIIKHKIVCLFQEIAVAFCVHVGKNYLIAYDCYSDWATIIPMGYNITTSYLITTLFSQTVVPDVFWYGGGPQFTANKFQCLAEKCGI